VSDTAVLDALAALPHFRTLDPATLDRVAGCARLVRLERGEAVFLMGTEAQAFYVVRTGAVRLFRTTPDGREQVVRNLRPGHSFAEAAVFNLGRYPVHAEARTTPTELVAVGGTPFRALLESEAGLATAVIGSLCQRLSGLVERVEELSVSGADARLARYLLQLPARAVDGGFEVELPAAKKDLASELGLVPETFSRLLRRWRDSEVVAVDGPRVRILAVEALEELAFGDDSGSS